LRLHSCECVSRLVSSSSGKGFRCSSSTSSLWVVYNIGRSYAFFNCLIFLCDHTGTLFLGTKRGTLLIISVESDLGLGAKGSIWGQANIKRVLGV
jgi:hypothetical protein